MISIREFRERFKACSESLQWTEENCKTMQDVWDKAPDHWFWWVASQRGVVSEIDFKRFHQWCVRRVWGDLTDEARSFMEGGAAPLNIAQTSLAATYAMQAAAVVISHSLYGKIIDTSFFVAMSLSLKDHEVGSDSQREARHLFELEHVAWIRANIQPNWEL